MGTKDKVEFEYVYLEIPIVLPPLHDKKENGNNKKENSSIIIDLSKDDDINVIDFNIL